MKIFKNITNGYRKIASGIAIVAFLALLYFALIPAGSMATVFSASGVGIGNAFVKLVDYPQYNTTTSNVVGHVGEYSIPNVPYDGIAGGSTYLIRANATGYAINTTTVFVNGDVSKEILLSPGVKYIASGQSYDILLGGQWKSSFRVGNLGTQPTTLDVNFLNTNYVTKNTSIDVIKNMTSINYDWSKWVTTITGDTAGSGTVTSEQPIDVITLMRSDREGKLGYFEGAPLNAQGTKWFVPGLTYDSPRGGQWRSGFTVTNIGNNNADVTLKFYNSNGALINTINNASISPKAAIYYSWQTYGYIPSGSLANAIDGTATVTSNNGEPLVILANVASEISGKIGYWNGNYMNEQKTDVFVSGLSYDAPLGGQWRSGFIITNLGDINATVNISLYDSTGALITKINRDILPRSSPYFAWKDYGYLASGSSSLAISGTARVESTNNIPIYVVENQASEVGGLVDFYPAAELNGNNTAGVIYQKYEGGERSGITVTNPGSLPIDIVIKFYNATGVQMNTKPDTLSGKVSKYYAWVTYTTEPYGMATVDATGWISVKASIASENPGKLGIYKGIRQQ